MYKKVNYKSFLSLSLLAVLAASFFLMRPAWAAPQADGTIDIVGDTMIISGTVRAEDIREKEEYDAQGSTKKIMLGSDSKILSKNGNNGAFYSFPLLTTFDSAGFTLSFDTETVGDQISVEGLFAGNHKLTNTSSEFNLDTSNVADFSSMFGDCSSITDFSFLSTFSFQNAQNVSKFFENTTLSAYNLPDSFTTTKVEDMSSLFRGCSKATSISFPDTFSTQNVRTIDHMFAGCTKLTDFSFLSTFDTGKLENITGLFENCDALTDFTIPVGFTIPHVTEAMYVFKSCDKLRTVVLPDTFDTSTVRNMEDFFSQTPELKSITFSDHFITKNVTNFDGMFNNSGIEKITFPTTVSSEKLDSMVLMFFGCAKLKKITFPPSFTAEKVRNMKESFYGCSNLTSVNLGTLKPTALENAENMFAGCQSLTKADLSHFSYANDANLKGAFLQCDKLEELNLGNVKTQGTNVQLNGVFATILQESKNLPTIVPLPNLRWITFNSDCILEPGDSATMTGTFFNYDHPAGWNAYQGNILQATLHSFEDFKSYQATHPGMSLYVWADGPQPEPPLPPDPDPTPDPEPSEKSGWELEDTE